MLDPAASFKREDVLLARNQGTYATNDIFEAMYKSQVPAETQRKHFKLNWGREEFLDYIISVLIATLLIVNIIYKVYSGSTDEIIFSLKLTIHITLTFLFMLFAVTVVRLFVDMLMDCLPIEFLNENLECDADTTDWVGTDRHNNLERQGDTIFKLQV